MDQITGTTPADGPSGTQEEERSPDAATASPPAEAGQPGFAARGRMRRRARFLRKARELAYRDLGGLVFSLHRYGQRNDALVMAKLATLGHIDAELRALESTLASNQPVTVLREAGITACARCAAIHSSEDRFCPNCGLAMGPHADLPIAGAPVASPPAGPLAQPASPPQAQPSAGPPAPPATPTPPTPVVAAAPATTPSPSQQAAPGADEPTEILRPPSAGR